MSKPKPPAFFAMFAAADAARFGEEGAKGAKPVVPPWERFERPIEIDLMALARRNLRKGNA